MSLEQKRENEFSLIYIVGTTGTSVCTRGKQRLKRKTRNYQIKTCKRFRKIKRI